MKKLHYKILIWIGSFIILLVGILAAAAWWAANHPVTDCVE